ncbi:HAMP domain-containing sensor histidine kinase [Tahibacter sp.]|uniref:sensor histidine kinase n=1 Tax=Tahibacter sp. TaxID=2056211 RepID=UPI0028C459D7|nr:HAMP domain-containing sensor histidine kinase [Tahibacter sp.]
MSRLYLRFYLALLGSLLVFVIAAAMVWHRHGGPVDRANDVLAQLVQNTLPPADATPSQQHAALRQIARDLGADVSLLAPDRSPLAAVGEPRRATGDHVPASEWLQPWKPNARWSIHLPDGRWLVIGLPIGFRHPAYALLLTLSVLAIAVAVGAYPIVRRLAQRLERLQRGVESLGAGNLAARVAVEGSDEIARLAQSFNHAALRIESLVGAHKDLLANASHELRTPLARIRMAVELLKGGADAKQKAGLERDIVELDHLIGEILLASRLDALHDRDVNEDVDLLALTAEECARYTDVQLDGTPCSVRGDPNLLRRMLRNLLDNAARHGRPPVHVEVIASKEIRVVVSDAGPGIPTAQCERIFEPFFRRSESRNEAGAGLGLALVRQIAHRHGGQARYETGSSSGSRFIVVLPPAPAA